MIEPFSVTAIDESDLLTLRFSGELDLRGADVLQRLVGDLLDGPARTVVLDCTDLHFLDAAGVSPLVRLANGLGRTDARVKAETVRPMPALLLSMTPIEIVRPAARSTS